MRILEALGGSGPSKEIQSALKLSWYCVIPLFLPRLLTVPLRGMDNRNRCNRSCHTPFLKTLFEWCLISCRSAAFYIIRLRLIIGFPVRLLDLWVWHFQAQRMKNDTKIITVWGPVLSNLSIVDPNASLAKTAETALCGGAEVCSCCSQEPAVRGCCWTDVPKCLMVLLQVASHIRCGHESSIRTRNWIFAVSGVKLIDYSTSMQGTARNHWMGARHAWWHVCVRNGVRVPSDKMGEQLTKLWYEPHNYYTDSGHLKW